MVCEGQASLPHPGLAQRKARTAPPWLSGSPQSDGERRSTLGSPSLMGEAVPSQGTPSPPWWERQCTLGSPQSDGRGCPPCRVPQASLMGEAVGSFQSEEGETALPMESTVCLREVVFWRQTWV